MLKNKSNISKSKVTFKNHPISYCLVAVIFALLLSCVVLIVSGVNKGFAWQNQSSDWAMQTATDLADGSEAQQAYAEENTVDWGNYEPLVFDSAYLNGNTVYGKTESATCRLDNAAGFYAANRNNSSQFSSGGLPLDGQLKTDEGAYEVPFQLNNGEESTAYDGNDSVWLGTSMNTREDVLSHTVNFKSTGVFKELYVLATAGDCPNSGTPFTITLNYTDNTSSTTSISLYDWYNSNSSCGMYKKIMRTSDGSYSNGSTSSGPMLFAVKANCDSTKQAKSINFKKTSSTDGAKCGVYAMSGIIDSNAPAAPVATAASYMSSSGFTLNWNTVSGAASYVIDVSTDSSFTTGNILSNVNVGNVTSYKLSKSISPNTTYYYRVRAANSSGTQGKSSNVIDTTFIKIQAGSDTITYDGKEHTSQKLAQTSFTINGSTYTVSGGLPTTPAKGTEAGTYDNGSAADPSSATVKKDGTTLSTGYCVYTDSTKATLKITQAVPTLELFNISTPSSKVYDGTNISAATVSSTKVSGWSWKYMDSSGTTYPNTTTFKNVISLHVVIYVSGDTNYSDKTLSHSTVFEISKKPIEYTALAYSQQYDGVKHGITVTPTGKTVEGKDFVVTYAKPSGTYSTENPTYKDVVSTTTYFRITDPDTSGNYETIEGSKTVVVSKRVVTLESPSGSWTYDAAEHSATTEAKLNNMVDGETYSITMNAATTIKNVGTIDNKFSYSDMTVVWGTAKETNYTVSDDSTKFTYGTLSVSRANVTITANNFTKTYGNADPTYSYTATGMKGGEDPTKLFTISYSREDGENVGAYFVTPGGNTEQSNYKLSFVRGQLEITKRPLTVNTFSESKTYDGTALTGSGEAIGWASGDEPGASTSDVKFNVTGSITNYGIDDNTCKITWGTKVKESNYNVTTTIGKLSISKKSVQIETPSATKVYDGDPLTAPDGSITGLVDETDCTITVTGTRTSVGVADNTYNLSWKNATIESNYIISSVKQGVLYISEYADEIPIITTGETFVYDGKEHWASVTVPSSMPKGYTIVKKDSQYKDYTTAHGTDVTDGPVTATCDNLKIMNAQNEDVTERLNIRKLDGALVINPAPLTITTSSASKVYDGTALTKTDGYTFSGLVNGETAGFSVTGTQTSAGKSQNGYTITWAGSGGSYTAKETNYSTIEDLGTLTVDKRPLYIETGSKTEKYSGSGEQTLTCSDITYTPESEGKGFIESEGSIVTDGIVTSSGETKYQANTYKFVWNPSNNPAENEYSANNYDISTKIGELVILEGDKVYVWVPGGTFTYDGTEHSATIQVMGPDSAGYNVTYTGAYTTATEVGKYTTGKEITKDNLTVKAKSTGTTIENWEVISDEIIIKQREVNITTPSATKPYDGATLKATKGEISGLASTDTEKVSLNVTGSRLDAGYTRNIYELTYDSEKGGSEEWFNKNYTINDNVGTLSVNTVKASVTTYSAKKTYDGKALTARNVHISGVVDGDLTTEVTGTQTAVGKSTNTVDCKWKEIESNENEVLTSNDSNDTKESNYQMTYVTGELNVVEYNNIISFSADNKSVVYDGQPHTIDVVSSTCPEGYEFADIGCSQTQTDVGKKTVKCDTYKIYRIESDGTKTDVTQALIDAGCIATPEAQIEITERTLTITTESNSKTYDGNSLTAKSWKIDNFAKGESANLINIPSITHVAQSGTTLTYEIDWTSTTAKSSNYKIGTENLGTLTVTQRPVSIAPEAKTKVYDTGDPQLTAKVMDGIETSKELKDVIPQDEGKIAYTLSRTKGEDVIYKTNDESEYGGYTISATYDTSQNNYTVSATTNELVITPATIDYDSHNGSRDFDGFTTAPPDSLVEVRYPSKTYEYGYTVEYSTTPDGTYSEEAPKFRDAGTHKIYYKITAKNFFTVGGEKDPKYFTLTINPISIASSNVEITLGDDLTYNGKDQTKAVAKIVCGEYELVEGANQDYQIEAGTDKNKPAGTYTMQINGSRNFTSSTTIDWTIAQKEISAKWNGEDSYVYNTKHQSKTTEALDVCEGDTVNCEYDFTPVDTLDDYVSAEQTNEPTKTIDVGKYHGDITNIDNANYKFKHEESCECDYEITPLSIKDAVVTQGPENTYNGRAQTQTIASVFVGDIEVPADTGYWIEGNSASSAGHFNLVVHGVNNFTDLKEEFYNLLPKPVNIKWDGNFRFLESEEAQAPEAIVVPEELCGDDEADVTYAYYERITEETEEPVEIEKPIEHGKYTIIATGVTSSDYELIDDPEVNVQDFLIAKSTSDVKIVTKGVEAEVEGLEEAAASEMEKYPEVDDFNLTMNIETKEVETATGATDIKTLSQKELFDLYDISVTASLDGKEQPLHATDNVLQVKIKHEYPEGIEFAPYRYHDGAASAMTQIDSVVKEEEDWVDNQAVVDRDNNEFVVYSDKFSTFGVGYNPVPEIVSPSQTPTSDSTNIAIVVGLLVASAIIAGASFARKRARVRS